MKSRNVVIVDGARSPFARGGRGKLVATRLDDVGAKIVRTLLDKHSKVKDTMIEDVGLGNVSGKGEFVGLSRVIRMAGLPMEVTSFNSNRQCGSSMETLHRIASAIMVGAIDCGMSLGIERMGTALGGGGGNAPAGRIFGARALQRNDLQRKMANDHDQYFSVPFPDQILDALPGSMTQSAQNVVDAYGLTREELDAFSANSHLKSQAAIDKGIYKDEIIPLEVEEPVFDAERNWVEEETGTIVPFENDECVRPDSTPETLAALGPVKGIKSHVGNEVVITAGNSCPTNDGVSAALLMSEEMALALGLTPLARIIGIGVGGVKPQVMGLGPIVSTKKALKMAGIEASQIQRTEFNEAFASQAIACIRDIGLTPEEVNVNGGSIAIGHPLGATGTRLVLTVAKELRRSGTRYGLASQCIGAGMGISTIIEALD
ncbi:MAG: thiolase family protein [Pseudomonadales bacterium]